MYDLKNLTSQNIDRNVSILTSLASALALMAAIGVMATSCVDATVKTAEIQEQYYSKPLTAEQEQFKSFFQRHGSPAPVQMAVAVTSTKRPALMAAIAIRESRGNPKAVGDNGKAKGAFQVWPEYWGDVPTDAAGQAKQAEQILEALEASHARGSLLQALAYYNTGDTRSRVGRRYAQAVMALRRQL